MKNLFLLSFLITFVACDDVPYDSSAPDAKKEEPSQEEPYRKILEGNCEELRQIALKLNLIDEEECLRLKKNRQAPILVDFGKGPTMQGEVFGCETEEQPDQPTGNEEPVADPVEEEVTQPIGNEEPVADPVEEEVDIESEEQKIISSLSYKISMKKWNGAESWHIDPVSFDLKLSLPQEGRPGTIFPVLPFLIRYGYPNTAAAGQSPEVMLIEKGAAVFEQDLIPTFRFKSFHGVHRPEKGLFRYAIVLKMLKTDGDISFLELPELRYSWGGGTIGGAPLDYEKDFIVNMFMGVPIKLLSGKEKKSIEQAILYQDHKIKIPDYHKNYRCINKKDGLTFKLKTAVPFEYKGPKSRAIIENILLSKVLLAKIKRPSQGGGLGDEFELESKKDLHADLNGNSVFNFQAFLPEDFLAYRLDSFWIKVLDQHGTIVAQGETSACAPDPGFDTSWF